MPKSKVVSASITEEQKEFIDENNVSPSQILQSKLNEMKEGGNPYKFTPMKYLSEGRKQGLVLILTGAFILTVGIALSFLMTASAMSVWPFVIIWGVGMVVSYYGYHEYSKWNDILYWRSKMEPEEEIG